MKAVPTRIAVLLVAALGALGLTACTPHTGAAAVVGGTRISEKSVQKYVIGSGTENSRRLVVTYLIKQALYQRYLTDHGGVPSEAALAASHDKAVSFGFDDQTTGQTIGTGAQADASLETGLKTVMVDPGYRSVVLRALELEIAAISRLNATQAAPFFADIRKAGISVAVAPRYGTWNATVQDLQAPVTPNFLKVAATTAAAAG